MRNQQLYFAILVPVFTVIMASSVNILAILWQAKGIEKRLDRIESRLTTIEQDCKVFFQDIARIKSKIGL